MKILYIVHQFYPEYHTGTEKFVYQNALMAQKAGNKVKVIAYSFYPDTFYTNEDQGVLTRDYIYKGIPVTAFKYKKQPIDLHIDLANKQLHEYAKKSVNIESPDVIHVGHPMRVHEFIRVAIETQIPYIITLTDFFYICPKVILAPTPNSLCSGPQGGKACSILCGEFPEKFISTRLKMAEELLVNANLITAPSEFVAKIFKEEFPYLSPQIIGHGISYQYINKNNRVYNGDDELVVGYAGTLAPHKGVHLLVKAFTMLESKKIKLVIYGSGETEYLSAIKEIAGTDKRITFMGTYSSERIGDIYTGIDVLVIPSICYESYSLVLHEALASNVPVIASNLGGAVEKIRDGINGYLFKAGSNEDLARKIELIIDNPAILNYMKANIISTEIVPALEQESYKYINIYRNIFESRNTSRNSSEI